MIRPKGTLLLLALIALAGCATTAPTIDAAKVAAPYTDYSTLSLGQIIHVPTGRVLTEEELTTFLARQRVVYVGESHDSVEDHGVELKVLKALEKARPGKVALGLEMLRTNSQPDADKWSAGELSEKEMVRVWVKNWGNTWNYYSEIMKFARDHKIPVIAMNRPRPAMPAHKTEEEAAKALEAQKANPEPEPEIDYDDPYYQKYIGAFFAGHDAGGPEIVKKFMKGQLLWDETMAQSGADFLKRPENSDTTLVVMAGGNHVRYGIGIPRRLFRRLPESYAIVEPVVLNFPEEKKEKLMDVDLPDMPFPSSDFIWTVGYTDLEGDTIKLGVGISETDGKGVTVGEVFDDTSAKKAGILSGDVIVSIDNVPVNEIFDLTYELTKKKKGDEGRVTVLREGKEIVIPVVYDTLKKTSP